jgi:hypothetical protein
MKLKHVELWIAGTLYATPSANECGRAGYCAIAHKKTGEGTTDRGNCRGEEPRWLLFRLRHGGEARLGAVLAAYRRGFER